MENDSSTELARAHFFSHFSYTRNDLAGDYETKLLRYRDDTWDYPKRAARLSAAVKRYKTYRMLCFIFEIAESVDLDFTPLVVKRLCTALFGRSGSQNIIVATFGQKGRVHRSRDSSPSVISEVAERYRLAAHSCLASTLSDIESVRKHYQAGIRTARKQEE